MLRVMRKAAVATLNIELLAVFVVLALLDSPSVIAHAESIRWLPLVVFRVPIDICPSTVFAKESPVFVAPFFPAQ
ncbi:hypothetical protein AN416_29745 (plasmid) [Paraburkholderia caribensis]|jgi:hypothetical protein|nr:hypothetical protein AN416_29745 [Paraburkholderia caribensis]AUT56617.1 hypothetical protein C2L66_32650 [Paraburkholderia caribensis]